ncbi:MAG: hypothetical protein KAT70_07640, partial [Thermoplasmata archaeon]|nr:hypothetical protein [Thermoplasmata archaeon]
TRRKLIQGIAVILLVGALMVIIAVRALGDEDDFSTINLLTDVVVENYYLLLITSPDHEMAFTPDGQIKIDGKDVKELSHPDIKAAIRSIALWIVSQNQQEQHILRLSDQTDYLLTELGKCREGMRPMVDGPREAMP